MKLAELSMDLRERITAMRFDRIIEKHEGPARWSWELGEDGAEFMNFDGYWVLLPLSTDQRPNITLLRCIPSADNRSLTLFLKDTTYCDEEDNWHCAGYLAVCEKLKGENFYVATVYHEWFILENEGLE